MADTYNTCKGTLTRGAPPQSAALMTFAGEMASGYDYGSIRCESTTRTDVFGVLFIKWK